MALLLENGKEKWVLVKSKSAIFMIIFISCVHVCTLYSTSLVKKIFDMLGKMFALPRVSLDVLFSPSRGVRSICDISAGVFIFFFIDKDNNASTTSVWNQAKHVFDIGCAHKVSLLVQHCWRL